MSQDIKGHIFDIIKGAVASTAVTILTMLLQYLGAHIPDIIAYLGSVAAGVAGVKAGK